ncbi:DUF4190 domain-containing protein [Streptacidiphilus melanogenes]|uniref:DUF4190 domain-containing protein n=1 Tax=Streptacidiphilus melanogenes TaxID=411235 RepID=UPI0005A5D8B3|nr:DUF4190 domain-containing protein [Streptacidiphilus melanogenes]
MTDTPPPNDAVPPPSAPVPPPEVTDGAPIQDAVPGHGWAAPGYPAPGYPAPGYLMPPMPDPAGGRSGVATASFVLGLLGLFPLGLILGIVALVRIGRTRQRGKVLAILGVVFSSLWLLGTVLSVLLAAVSLSMTQSHSSALPGIGAGAHQRVGDMALGTCYNEPANAQSVDWVTVVPCSDAHQRQLFARITVTGTYPGLDEAKRQSQILCNQALYGDYVDPWALGANGAVLHYYYPEEQAWQSGEGDVWCTVGARSGFPDLNRDLRQSASTFSPRQRAFLDAVRQTGLLRRELEDTPEAAWTHGQGIAAQLAVADRAEATALGSLSALDTGSLRAASAQLAQYDLAEAARADALAKATSQGDWFMKSTTGFWDQDLQDEFDLIRTEIGLPSIG